MADPEIPDRGYNTKDVAEVAAPKRKSFARRHWGKLALAAILGIPSAVQLARSYAALAFTYSTGDRIGYVQKLSRKGWVCKTWEGELQISNIPGSAPVLFYFTVRDDSIAAAIQGAEGSRSRSPSTSTPAFRSPASAIPSTSSLASARSTRSLGTPAPP